MKIIYLENNSENDPKTIETEFQKKKSKGIFSATQEIEKKRKPKRRKKKETQKEKKRKQKRKKKKKKDTNRIGIKTKGKNCKHTKYKGKTHMEKGIKRINIRDKAEQNM